MKLASGRPAKFPGFCGVAQHKQPQCGFKDDLLALATAHTLLVLDRGFYDFEWWANLIAKQVDFICGAKSKLAYTVIQELSLTPRLKDRLIEIGQDQQGHPLVRLRLIEVPKGQGWYRYLTSVLDPEVLPPYVVVDLYARRWRIEDAFHVVKRLLGLADLWTGSLNGIKLQIWATWLIDAVLVDLSDAVAEAVPLPLERISMEMVWPRPLSFQRCLPSRSGPRPGLLLSSPENRDLEVIKTMRKPPKQLDFSPSVKALPETS